MLPNFAYCAQIMLHMPASVLHKFNISFLKIMSVSSLYFFSN